MFSNQILTTSSLEAVLIMEDFIYIYNERIILYTVVTA